MLGADQPAALDLSLLRSENSDGIASYLVVAAS